MILKKITKKLGTCFVFSTFACTADFAVAGFMANGVFRFDPQPTIVLVEGEHLAVITLPESNSYDFIEVQGELRQSGGFDIDDDQDDEVVSQTVQKVSAYTFGIVGGCSCLELETWGQALGVGMPDVFDDDLKSENAPEPTDGLGCP